MFLIYVSDLLLIQYDFPNLLLFTVLEEFVFVTLKNCNPELWIRICKTGMCIFTSISNFYIESHMVEKEKNVLKYQICL